MPFPAGISSSITTLSRFSSLPWGTADAALCACPGSPCSEVGMLADAPLLTAIEPRIPASRNLRRDHIFMTSSRRFGMANGNLLIQTSGSVAGVAAESYFRYRGNVVDDEHPPAALFDPYVGKPSGTDKRLPFVQIR